MRYNGLLSDLILSLPYLSDVVRDHQPHVKHPTQCTTDTVGKMEEWGTSISLQGSPRQVVTYGEVKQEAESSIEADVTGKVSVTDTKQRHPKLFCPICNSKTFINKHNLKYHIRKYHAPGQHAGEAIDDNTELNLVNEEAQMSIVLEIGNPTAHSISVLGSSKKKISKKREKPYICQICNKQVTNLKSHLRTHTGIKDCICHVCGKCFAYSSGLKKHMIIHLEKKPLECQYCNKGFLLNYDLTLHMKSHTGQKGCVCDICGKGLYDKTALKRHIQIHTGEKPFKCNECEKPFCSQSELNQHKHIHSQERKFTCDICGKSFKQYSQLCTHRIIHSDKKHQCTLCAYSTVWKWNMKNHMLKHAGVKPYKCTLCEKSFTRSSDLKDHVIIHSGDNPHRCLVCRQTFASSRNLKRHKLRHKH